MPPEKSDIDLSELFQPSKIDGYNCENCGNSNFISEEFFNETQFFNYLLISITPSIAVNGNISRLTCKINNFDIDNMRIPKFGDNSFK